MSIIIVVEHAGIEQFLPPNRDQDLISKTVAERVQESKLSSEIGSSICDLRTVRSQQYVLTLCPIHERVLWTTRSIASCNRFVTHASVRHRHK